MACDRNDFTLGTLSVQLQNYLVLYLLLFYCARFIEQTNRLSNFECYRSELIAFLPCNNVGQVVHTNQTR